MSDTFLVESKIDDEIKKYDYLPSFIVENVE